MKLTISFSVLILTLAIQPFAEAQSSRVSRYAISFDRFGPVRIGMTVPAAARALGVRLVRQQGYDEICHYVRPGVGFKGVTFMVTHGRIARVDVEDRSYRTVRGAKIGDTESQIKRLYAGRVVVSPHAYVDWAHYLIVSFRGGKFLIVFETDGKRVMNYRVGRNPEAGFVEGCS